MKNKSLEQYKKDKILTVELIVDASIHSVSPTPPSEWVEIIKIIDELKKEIEKFHEKCWSDIKIKHHEEATYTLFRFVHEDVQMASLETMGRILNTISINDKKMVTIVGNASPKFDQKCGLQGISATKEEAIRLIRYIIKHWNPKKFNVYKNVSVSD